MVPSFPYAARIYECSHVSDIMGFQHTLSPVDRSKLPADITYCDECRIFLGLEGFSTHISSQHHRITVGRKSDGLPPPPLEPGDEHCHPCNRHFPRILFDKHLRTASHIARERLTARALKALREANATSSTDSAANVPHSTPAIQGSSSTQALDTADEPNMVNEDGTSRIVSQWLMYFTIL